MPRIAVLTTVYKEPIEWIKTSMQSILHQTYTDFEYIILVDNPSYKEAIECIGEMATQDSRIRLYVNEENIGLTKSLNRALQWVNAEYVARLDADDISYPTRLETQLNFMDTHSNISVCGAFVDIANDKGVRLNKKVLRRPVKPETILLRNYIVHSTAMFRTSLLKLRKPFYNEDYFVAQDVELWSFLFLCDIGFHIVETPLVMYRFSGNQIGKSWGSTSCSNAQKAVRLLNKNFLLKHQVITEQDSTDTSVVLHKVENSYSRFDARTQRSLRMVVVHLNSYLVKDSRFYLLRYLFNKHAWIFHIPFKYTCHLIKLTLSK
jgi:glycosyltransferase involved in cell wall biosynthesis